jgi:putative PEP-CTERM system TPR-repeat lipoprotein
MSNARIRHVGALFLAALMASSCSNPETEKVRHLERGNQYAAEKRDEFAVVEYASAVKIDPKFGEARFKLAETYERLNNVRAAFPEYIRAADALPDDRKAQLRATQVLLLGRRFEDAKARAAALLAKNPKDVEVMLLHANAMASLRDPAGAIAEIEEALKVSPDSSAVFMNLGAVRMQKGEATAAEAAFRQAIALDPSFVDAKLALANFLWVDGRVPEAEAMLKEALAKEPQHLLANRMLGLIYLSTKRLNEAEQPLKVVADASKLPAARFQLADYYVSVGRTTDAVSLLTPLSSDPATFAEAESRLAAMDYSAGRTAEAHKRLDAVLKRMPKYSPVLVMKAQWLTRENKLDEALDRAQAAVAADPQSAAAHFALAVVHDRRREVAAATKSYNEVLRLNPRAVAAQVELSRLSLSSGDKAGALRYAERARLAEPSNLDARVALARSLLVAGNLNYAETEIAALLKQAPNAAVVHALNGTLQATRKNTVAARTSFERAVEISPGFVEAVGGLTYLDLVDKNPARAIARLESEITKQPTSAPLLALLARVHSAAGDEAAAEQALRRAVSVDPRFTDGYTMLAKRYMKQGRLDEARAEFEGIAKRDPSAIGARTMVGMLLEAQGKREEAKKSYEATVNATENAPFAANNLAFIYAEQGTNLDVALRLATSAKQGLPEDPNVDDTLGWVYYKNDMASLALRPLQDSLRKRPDDPGVLYHLGMTYAKLGDKPKARETLERALKLDPKIGGDDARRALASASQ